MEIKQANFKQTEKKENNWKNIILWKISLDNFVWQEEIKNILKSAILSAQKRNDSLWHILFSWDSWFGKTTLANIIAQQLGKNIKITTAYAMEKPADMISILNQLEEWDILFIDEIHRLKPKIEEILYIAMEEFRVDIVMQDESMSLPINKFTLIWASNKLENLSDAFKNRFVYKFHLKPYTQQEIEKILKIYLDEVNIKYSENCIKKLAQKSLPVPREIRNLSIKIRDYLIANWKWTSINNKNIENIIKNLKLEDYGLSNLQKRYLEILEEKELAW